MNVLKRLEKYISAIFKLGQTERIAKATSRGLSDMRQHNETQLSDMRQHNETQLSDMRQHNETEFHAAATSQVRRQQHFEDTLRETTRGTLRDIHVRHGELARSYSELSHRLDRVLLTCPRAEVPLPIPQRKMEGLDALNQSVLSRLAALSPQPTKGHLSSLLPEVETAVLRAGEAPILDLYAGDGTWLALLKQAGLPASAAHDMSGIALQVWVDEIRNNLASQKDSSLSVVSVRHLMACLPFGELLWLARETMRLLAPGGILLIETADAEMLGIDYYDNPYHLRPLTKRSLQAVLETLGFEDISMQHMAVQNLVCLSTKPLLGA
jgi:hypothetical protein